MGPWTAILAFSYLLASLSCAQALAFRGSQEPPTPSQFDFHDGDTNRSAIAESSASQTHHTKLRLAANQGHVLPFEPDRETVIGNDTASTRSVEREKIRAPSDDQDGTFRNPVESMTLTQIESIALENNSAIAAARATIAKTAGLRQQVGTRPNPRFGYFGQQLGDRNTDQHGLYIEQEFVRGNKLQLNRQVLCQTQIAQTVELSALEYRVLTDVRTRFFQAVAAQLEVEATSAFLQVASRGVQVAEDRQRAGEGTLIETLQAQTLLSEVSLSAERARLAFRGAWGELVAIAGISQHSPVQLATELPVPNSTPNWETTFLEIIARSPEISIAQAIVREKDAMLQRQQVQAIPNITGQLGAGHDVGTNHGMINIQVSAPIPIHNLNRGNISAAHADLLRASHQVERIQQSIRSRLARAAQDFDAALTTVQRYQHEIIPQTEKSLSLSEDAYRKGELDFLQVLIVRRSYYESTIRLIHAKSELAQVAARIDGLLLTGGLDSPTDFSNGDSLREQTFGGQ
jgi:cobalt-zinc-cadmium efflux system outer membrane protein